VPKKPHKRRTREHIIADLGVNHVERQVLLSGNTVQRWLHDYGIDLLLSTYSDNGEPDGGKMFMQVKATDLLRLTQDGRFATCRVERAHLRAWLAEPLPVFLVVYDVPENRAYWIFVQAAFQGEKRYQAASGTERLTIRVPLNQVLDPDAVKRFRIYHRQVMERIERSYREEQ
jgi:hypothetical protein